MSLGGKVSLAKWQWMTVIGKTNLFFVMFYVKFHLIIMSAISWLKDNQINYRT